MSDIYFKCECGKSLAVDEAGIGRSVSCVDCGNRVTVPEPEVEFDCEGCAETLLAPSSVSGDLIKCAACGHSMTVPPDTMVDLSVGRDFVPASSSSASSVACAPSRGTGGAFRATEFTIRRRPPRRNIFADPKLSGRLFRVAVAALAVVLVAEVMRGVFRAGGSAPDEFSDVSTSQEREETLSPALITYAVHEQKEETLVCEQQAENPSISHPAVPEPVISHSEMSASTPQVLLAASTAESNEEITLLAESNAASDPDPAKPEVPAGGKGDFLLMDRVLIVQDLISADRQEFGKAVPRLWAEALEYTQTHSGGALDGDDWFNAFRTAAEWTLSERSLTYDRSLALVEQALDALRGTRPEDRSLPTRLAMDLAMTHSERWLRPRTLECAGLVDDVWAWAESLDDPGLKRACFGRALFFDGNLLINRFAVPEDDRSHFIDEVERKLWMRLDDEDLSLNDRTDALSHWATALHDAGRKREALIALVEWRERHGQNIVSARYYRALFELALFGMGDWDMAGMALNGAARQRTRWTSSHDDALFAGMCRLYYDNMLCNGYELVRAGSERRQARERELRVLAAGAAGGKS